MKQESRECPSIMKLIRYQKENNIPLRELDNLFLAQSKESKKYTQNTSSNRKDRFFSFAPSELNKSEQGK